MNILLCIDDFRWDYTRHCAVTIISLLETNKKNKIKIFIMSSYIPDENVKELKRIVSEYHQEIEFIIHNNIIPEEIQSTVINRRNLTRGTWYRLFFPLYIKNVDRILYLDCDVLVNKDISTIYNMNMHWKAIVWYYDIPTTRFVSEKKFWLNQYINAWVLLIDVYKFSKYKFTDKLIIDINKKYWNYIDNSDQDYLNIIFKDDIYIHKKSMNYQIISKYFNIWLNDSEIIHCLEKPYVQYSNIPKHLVNLYNKYLNKTKRKNFPEKKSDINYIKRIFIRIRNFLFQFARFIVWDKLLWKIWGKMLEVLYKKYTKCN